MNMIMNTTQISHQELHHMRNVLSSQVLSRVLRGRTDDLN